jgi:hypothetical protein
MVGARPFDGRPVRCEGDGDSEMQIALECFEFLASKLKAIREIGAQGIAGKSTSFSL